jgi:S1-C subfamily serine protease
VTAPEPGRGALEQPFSRQCPAELRRRVVDAGAIATLGGFDQKLGGILPEWSRLMAHGQREHGEIAHQGKPIGVQLIPVTPSSDPSLKHGSERGMIVDSVIEGGVAEDVGIRGGDVLMAIDSKAVNTEEDVKAALNAAAPHHTAKML